MPAEGKRSEKRGIRGRWLVTPKGKHDGPLVSARNSTNAGLGAWPEPSSTHFRHSRVNFISAGHPSAASLICIPQGSVEKRNGHSPKNISTLRVHDEDPLPSGKSTTIQTKPYDIGTLSEHASPHQQMVSMSLAKNSQQSFDTLEKHNSVSLEVEKEIRTDDAFVIDVNGSQDLVPTSVPQSQTGMSSAPVDSDLGEEEIVFTGRNTRTELTQNLQVNPKPQANKWSALVSIRTATASSANHNSNVVDDPPSNFDEALMTSQFTPQSTAREENYVSRAKKRSLRKALRSGQPQGARKHARRSTKGDQIIEDYIANIQADEASMHRDTNNMVHTRDLGGFDGWQSETEKLAAHRISVESVEAWDSENIQDFDDFSTSSEEFEAVNKVLARRDRPSGRQYLVIGDGFMVDEARWLALSSLAISENAAMLIRRFDQEQAEKQYLLGGDNSDDSLTDDVLVDLDFQIALGEIEDGRDLDERRKARMADEQMARLLSKQEELGMGSDDLVLFDGDEGAVLAESSTKGLIGACSTKRVELKGNERASRPFSSAAALAQALEDDPFDSFDVMDLDRPILRRRPKGRHGHPALELSDSELEQNLRTAWENDRSKKKARKEAREELRSRGLLRIKNKNKTNPSLTSKYPSGMSIGQIKDEMKSFLSSRAEELVLPPMDANARKIVHDICHKLALKSQSRGSGNARHPIVYKTSRTQGFEEVAFASIYRKFLPRPGKAQKKTTHTVRGQGGALAGVSYQDGEIVGATAPELGQENRGRAMLEKMGWSIGTALGASNNKGIPVPVAQIVKTTRAGLG
ncbi:MAG: hypothetical protein Q9164_004270 [Protoblastenia rupestris]